MCFSHEPSLEVIGLYVFLSSLKPGTDAGQMSVSGTQHSLHNSVSGTHLCESSAALRRSKCRRIHTHSPDSGSAFSTAPHCLCLELRCQRGDERVCWEQGNGRGATRRVKFPGNLPINLYRFKATSESGRKLLWLQIISHPLCWKLFDVDLSTGSWLQANKLTFYGSQNHHGFYWSLFFLKVGAKGSRGSVLLMQPGSSLWTTFVCFQ